MSTLGASSGWSATQQPPVCASAAFWDILERSTGVTGVDPAAHREFVNRVVNQRFKLSQGKRSPEVIEIRPGEESDDEEGLPNRIVGEDVEMDWSPDAARVQSMIATGVLQLKSFGPNIIMHQFKTIRLAGMKIQSIDRGFLNLKNLEHLALPDNRLVRIEHIPASVVSLHVPGNRIVDFPDLSSLRLRALGLGHNLIAHIGSLSRQAEATQYIGWLDLGFNAISVMSELAHLSSLRAALFQLAMVGNPIYAGEAAGCRRELIRTLPRLNNLDEVAVTAEERVAAEAAPAWTDPFEAWKAREAAAAAASPSPEAEPHVPPGADGEGVVAIAEDAHTNVEGSVHDDGPKPRSMYLVVDVKSLHGLREVTPDEIELPYSEDNERIALRPRTADGEGTPVEDLGVAPRAKYHVQVIVPRLPPIESPHVAWAEAIEFKWNHRLPFVMSVELRRMLRHESLRFRVIETLRYRMEKPPPPKTAEELAAEAAAAAAPAKGAAKVKAVEVEAPKGQVFWIDKTAIVGEAIVGLQPLLTELCTGSQYEVDDYDPKLDAYPPVDKKKSKKDKERGKYPRRQDGVPIKLALSIGIDPLPVAPPPPKVEEAPPPVDPKAKKK
jgi:hypothetical protein